MLRAASLLRWTLCAGRRGWVRLQPPLRRLSWRRCCCPSRGFPEQRPAPASEQCRGEVAPPWFGLLGGAGVLVCARRDPVTRAGWARPHTLTCPLGSQPRHWRTLACEVCPPRCASLQHPSSWQRHAPALRAAGTPLESASALPPGCPVVPCGGCERCAQTCGAKARVTPHMEQHCACTPHKSSPSSLGSYTNSSSSSSSESGQRDRKWRACVQRGFCPGRAYSPSWPARRLRKKAWYCACAVSTRAGGGGAR